MDEKVEIVPLKKMFASDITLYIIYVLFQAVSNDSSLFEFIYINLNNDVQKKCYFWF